MKGKRRKARIIALIGGSAGVSVAIFLSLFWINSKTYFSLQFLRGHQPITKGVEYLNGSPKAFAVFTWHEPFEELRRSAGLELRKQNWHLSRSIRPAFDCWRLKGQTKIYLQAGEWQVCSNNKDPNWTTIILQRPISDNPTTRLEAYLTPCF